MSAKKCITCGALVSRRADVCPNCGEPSPADTRFGRQIRRLAGAIFLLFLFYVFATVFGGYESPASKDIFYTNARPK